MTDERTPTYPGDDDGEDVALLMVLAGPRRVPPAEVEARVRAATMSAFEALPEHPIEGRFPFRRPALALAATVLVGVFGAWLVLKDAAPSVAGEIVYASGGYTVRGSDDPGGRLLPGSILRTSSGGRLSVDLGKGRELRIDRGTRATVHSDSEVWLHDGRIYVDAGGNASLVVVTPNATISDVGTQFEVVVRGEQLGVATREGSVKVVLGDRQIRSGAEPGRGEELEIDGLTLLATRSVTTTGERWAWTQASRPLFSVAGRSVREYLNWAARESGRVLRFDTPVSEQQAGLRRLGGSAEVDADEASIGRVLAATAFELRAGETHELVVGLKTGAG